MLPETLFHYAGCLQTKTCSPTLPGVKVADIGLNRLVDSARGASGHGKCWCQQSG